MKNLFSAALIILLVIFVPKIIRSIPYFKRPDVLARRMAKAKLPSWISFVEFVALVASEALLLTLLFTLTVNVHQFIHPGVPYLHSGPITFSVNSIVDLIKIFAPMVIALPLGMVSANAVSWLIPRIRNEENRIMAEGVPGYSWKELNLGLIKFALVVAPVALSLVLISVVFQ